MLFYSLGRSSSLARKQATGPGPTCLGTKRGLGPKIGKFGGCACFSRACILVLATLPFAGENQAGKNEGKKKKVSTDSTVLNLLF